MYDVILWCTNYENVKIILRNIVVIEMFKKKIFLQSIVER